MYNKICIFFLFFTFFTLNINAEIFEIIDDYNKNSFANYDLFKKDENPSLHKKLEENVSAINEIVNFKKYHAIIPMVIKDNSCPNAFATTSNRIYVCSELVKKYSDCELRFIIAHEIAHIVNEDFKNRFNRMNSDKKNLDSEILYLTKKNRYSRVAEVVADRDAVVWTLLSGCKEKSIISSASDLFHGKPDTDSTHPHRDFRLRTITEKSKEFRYIKKNNIPSSDLYIEIGKYNDARVLIEEYIAFNLNDPIGYIKRINLNYIVTKKNKTKKYINPIRQDCNFIKKNFNKSTSICDKI